MTGELDQVRRATPWPQEHVSTLDLVGADHDLLDEIVSSPRGGSGGRTRPLWRSRRVVAVAAAAAVAVAVATPIVVQELSGDVPVTFPPAATRVAEANPRLLVDLPGWEVSDVQQFTAEDGEMSFTGGSGQLDVHWRPGEGYHDYLSDRSRGNPSRSIEVLGQDATLFQYRGTTDFTTILPPTGTSFLEIRGDLGSREEYLRVLAALTPVSTDEWLAAMPDNVVVPSDVDAVVARMLTGVPLPPGFRASPLSQDLAQDRYQLGATVSGSVLCAWLDRWDDARTRGDEQRAAEAVAALQSSRQWPVLLEMNAEGDFPEVAWEIADGAAGRNLDFFGGELTRQTWIQGLGCDSHPRNANMD